MKKILKFIFGVIGSIYLLFAIFVTVCLLCYNEYKVTQFGDKSFIIIDDKSDEYTSGDLVIFTKNPNEEITKGNKIFFYEVTHGKAQELSGEVTKSEKITDTETTFTIGGSHAISSESVIGKTETASVVPKVGKVLSIFESQYGFLMLIILPALLLFFYAVYSFIKELKDSKKEETETVDNTVQTDQPVAAQNATQQVDANVVPQQPQMQQPVQPTQAGPAVAAGMQQAEPIQPAPAMQETIQPVPTMQAEPQAVQEPMMQPAQPQVQPVTPDIAVQQVAPQPVQEPVIPEQPVQQPAPQAGPTVQPQTIVPGEPAPTAMPDAPAPAAPNPAQEVELPLPNQNPGNPGNNSMV